MVGLWGSVVIDWALRWHTHGLVVHKHPVYISVFFVNRLVCMLKGLTSHPAFRCCLLGHFTDNKSSPRGFEPCQGRLNSLHKCQSGTNQHVLSLTWRQCSCRLQLRRLPSVEHEHGYLIFYIFESSAMLMVVARQSNYAPIVSRCMRNNKRIKAMHATQTVYITVFPQQVKSDQLEQVVKAQSSCIQTSAAE